MSDVAPEGQDMTFDQAAAAIESAVSADPDFGGTPAEVTEVAQPAPDQADEQPTPGADVPSGEDTQFDAPDAEQDEFFAETNVNPDLLPDELQPLVKQLKGAFTQKTQALAEQRKELEALGSLEELQQAAEFYGSLRDPEYLKDFYTELGSVVREMGLVDDESAPAAPSEDAPADPPVVPSLTDDLQKLVADEPELAPFAQEMAAMRAELSGFRAEQEAAAQDLEQERAMLAEAAEISRQVDVVREAHPEYSEDDWEAIYDLADANDRNVLKGAEIFQALNDRAVAAWTARKQATPAAVQPVAGGGAVTEDGSEKEYTRLSDVDVDAIAYLEANDLQEFTG